MKSLISLIFISVIVVFGIQMYANSYSYPPSFDDNNRYTDLEDKKIDCQLLCKAKVIGIDFVKSVADVKADIWQRWILAETDGVLPYNLGCHRKFNVLLGILASIAVYFYLLYIFSVTLGKDFRWILPVIATAWFVFNPCGVYAIAYIIQKSIVMAALCSALSLLVFSIGLNVKYIGLPVMFLSLFLFKGALMGKEHAASLPAVMFVHYLFFWNKINYSKVAYLLRGLIFFGFVYYLYWRFMPHTLGPATEPHNAEALALFKSYTGSELYSVEWASRLTQCKMFFIYVSKWLFPQGLSIDLKYPIVTSLYVGLAWGAGLVAWALIGLRLIFKKKEVALVGLGMLAPLAFFLVEILTHSRISEQFVLYRSYLWMFSLFCIVPYMFKNISLKECIIFLAILSGILIMSYSIKLQTFSSAKAIWYDAVKYLPEAKLDRIWGSAHALNSLGVAYQQEGQDKLAIEAYDKAIDINPNYASPLSNKGALIMRYGRFDEARELLKKSGDNSAAWINLGALERAVGNLGAAEDYFKRAGANQYALLNLAKLYFDVGWCEKVKELGVASGLKEAEFLIKNCSDKTGGTNEKD